MQDSLELTQAALLADPLRRTVLPLGPRHAQQVHQAAGRLLAGRELSAATAAALVASALCTPPGKQGASLASKALEVLQQVLRCATGCMQWRCCCLLARCIHTSGTSSPLHRFYRRLQGRLSGKQVPAARRQLQPSEGAVNGHQENGHAKQTHREAPSEAAALPGVTESALLACLLASKVRLALTAGAGLCSCLSVPVQ